MNFIIEILIYIFKKPPKKTTLIILNIHHKNIKIYNTYPYKITKTKINLIKNLTHENKFPLKYIIKKKQIIINKKLNTTLNFTIKKTKKKHHKYINIKHILFTILYNPTNIDIIENYNNNINQLITSLKNFFKKKIKQIPNNNEYVLQQTINFQHIIQQTMNHTHSTEKPKITINNILTSIFLKKNKNQNITNNHFQFFHQTNMIHHPLNNTLKTNYLLQHIFITIKNPLDFFLKEILQQNNQLINITTTIFNNINTYQII